MMKAHVIALRLLSHVVVPARFLGVQTPAPRSIMACAKSPARRFGVKVAARRRSSGLAAGSGSVTVNSRATTLSMLPSTGLAGSPKAIAAMAAAV